jgi:hypothetical protein
MWIFGWVYPSLFWLPVLNCPWVAASPWFGNGGGGGGAPFAIGPCASACFNPMASCNFKNVLQSLIRWFETLFPST